MDLRELAEETALRLELPLEAALGSALVQLCSDKEAVIENHRGLVEYTGTLIGVACPGRTLRIEGQRLKVAAMNTFRIRITGKIDAVSFL